MRRRKFISHATVYSAATSVFMHGLGVELLPVAPILPGINSDSNKVLVLVQLQGGNDGLNTLVPLEYFSQLMRHRSNLLPDESKLLKLDGFDIGLHPALKGVRNLFDNGKLGVIHSVGYPNQNRSHFRSTDIWSSGSDANTYDSRGWLGKYLETVHNNYPEDYPNAKSPDPIAIAMGAITSETCQGMAGNFSVAVNDPFALSPLATGLESMTPDSSYGLELDFVRQEIEKTNAYTKVITTAARLGQSNVDYPQASSLAMQLKNVATLISGGLQTKIYICSMGGFDTHAKQVEDGNTHNGVHAELLSELDGAIAAFQQDLSRLGLEERVLGMTFSEFGRQIKSNDSLGTDHGTAAPLFLFGACVQEGFHGQSPEILEDIAPQEGVALQTDFRDVYGSILQQWFGAREDAVRGLLYADFRPLSLLGNCQLTATSTLTQKVDFTIFPNPFDQYLTVTIGGHHSPNQLSVYDAQGVEILRIFDKQVTAGKHTIELDLGRFPSGNYFIHLKSREGQATQSAVKIGGKTH